MGTESTDGDEFDNRVTHYEDWRRCSSRATRSSRARPQQALDAGVELMMFGAGVGASTDSVGSPTTDDYWWIERVGGYLSTLIPLP